MVNRPSSLFCVALTTGALAACSSSSSKAITDGGLSGLFDAMSIGVDAKHDTAQPGIDAAVDSHINIFVDAGRDTNTEDSGSDAPAPPVDSGFDSGVDATLPPVDAGVDSGHEVDLDAAKEAATKDAAKDSAKAVDAGVTETLLFLGTSSTSLYTGALPLAGTWTTASVASGASTFAPALTALTNGTAVGVMTLATGASVASTTWTAAGGWTTPAAITGATARAQPFIDGTGGTTAHLAFQDGTYNFQSAGFAVGLGWSTITPVNAYGPVPAAIASLGGTTATLGYTDGKNGPNDLAADDLSGTTWAAAVDLGGPIAASFKISPAIVPLTTGGELLMVFADQSAKLYSVVRTGTTWTAPLPIASATTNNDVALAPLPGGDAILAFTGTDGNLYWSLFSGGNWSTVAPLRSPNVAITGSPAITHGIGTDVAEIAFVESTGIAYSSSLAATTWNAPTLIGGTGLVGVALAAVP